MKKFISLLLVCALAMSSAALFAFAAEDDLNIAVANDIHVNVAKSTNPVKKGNSVNADFFHAGHSGQMPEESLAIATAFFELVAKDESEVLLLPGDLADGGTIEQHMAMTAMLAKFEAESGKRVFVVPGNHDFWGSGIADFKTLYREFGYSEAIAQDTLSTSYVAELNSEYRLLAIDSTKPGQSPHGMTQARVDWIEAQCKQAAADGKKLIAMMHHNLIEHFVLAKTIHKTAIVEGDVALAEVLAANGVKYIFTGHTHDTDIAAYTTADGSVIYDVVTAALFSYPCPYRLVKFSDKVTFEMRTVPSVDVSLLPPGITENALAMAQTDMKQYSKICTWIGVRNTVASYTTAASLKRLLKLDNEKDAAMWAIVDKVGTKINESLNMPLNASDVKDGAMSIESYLDEYDIVIPQTDYKDMLDIAVEIFQAHVVGDEYLPGYSDEVVSFVRGLAAVLHYSLADLTAEEYTTVLSYIAALLKIELSSDILNLAGNALSRMRGLELWLTTAIMPLICEYTVDDAPADNNVTLPGYEKTSEADAMSFFEEIIAFFKQIIDALRTFFAHFFG